MTVVLAPLPGCAPSRRADRPSGSPAAEARPRASLGAELAEDADVPEGAIHTVEAGQTLWRIAREYGVDLEDLARANGITDPDVLAVGQVLFVPGATTARQVLPYPAPFAAGPPREGGTEHPTGGGFVWPVPAGEVLSWFGAPRRGHRHAGLDIRGVPGQDVVATQAGDVIYSGDTLGDYGKMVILRHGNGLQSLYAHNSKLLVGVGDRVERGQRVALVGRTGNASTTHCHFELRKDNVSVDPSLYLAGRAPSAAADGVLVGPPSADTSPAGSAMRTAKRDDR